MDLTLTFESVLKLDAPFRLGVIQFEHGDSHDKDQNSGDELEYSCALYLKQLNAGCYGELTLPEIFGFFIEVRRFCEPYSDKYATDYNSNEKAERRTKKYLKSHVSDLKCLRRRVGHSWMRILRRNLFLRRPSSSSETSRRDSRTAVSPLSFLSSSSGVGICDPEVWKCEYTICSTRPRREAMIMAASRVSRKMMKKMGTENRLWLWVMVSGKRRAGRAWRKGLEGDNINACRVELG